MQFCRMELLQLIFKLGVVFAIFSFIWGFFELIAKFMTNGRSKTIVEIYVIKALKYLFLVDVTFLFSLNKTQEIIDLNNLIPTILVVLVYFIGKLQNKQNNAVIFQLMQQQNPTQKRFDLKAEIAVIIIALSLFGVFIFYPEISKNPLSLWFYDSIVSIEHTAIIGFIFKVIGFFFLVSLLTKMLNALVVILTGKPLIQTRSRFVKKDQNSDDFDDFEEINE